MRSDWSGGYWNRLRSVLDVEPAALVHQVIDTLVTVVVLAACWDHLL